MTISYKINGKKNVGPYTEESLQKVLRKNGLKTVKLGCSNGFCGNCMVLLNDNPVPSCKVSAASIQGDDEIVTLSYFQKTFPEAKDIAKGFEKAGINLCGYCDAGKFFTAYDLLKNGKPSKERILNAVKGLNTCCTDEETLCEGILYAYDFKMARKTRESNSASAKKNQVAVLESENPAEEDEIETTDANGKMFFPTSIQEAFHVMDKNPNFCISAGGTYEEIESAVDIQNIEAKPAPRDTIISLKKISELQSIERHERYIEIGAAVTLNTLLNHARIPQVLRDSVSQIGSHSMRNLSTIGGNICIPDHKGSTWSALLALDAKFEIASANEHKEIKKLVMAYEFKNPGPKEILTKIRIPINNWSTSIYRRLGSTNFLYGGTAGFSFLVETERDHIYNIKIAFSGKGELTHHDEIFKHKKKSLHKRVKYGFSSDLIGQKIPLPEKMINTCIANAEKIFTEKCGGNCDPMIEQQFKCLLRSALEQLM